MGGYVMLARQIFESKIWVNKPSTWKVIWIYIIGQVNHKEIAGFKRGEGFFMFKKELSNIGCDITPNMVKKCFIFLKQNEMIRTKRSTRGVTVEVLNFGKYQDPENYTGTDKRTKKELRKNLERTPINKNDKNEKNVNIPFSQFWELYKKKKDKYKCELKWGKLSDKEREDIIKHVPGYTDATPDATYRKNPLTYLNGKCWEDEITKTNKIINYNEPEQSSNNI